MTGYMLSPLAMADLSDIWDYSADKWGLAQADRYVLGIRSACEALAEGRQPGQSAEHIRHGYRKQFVGVHAVLSPHAGRADRRDPHLAPAHGRRLPAEPRPAPGLVTPEPSASDAPRRIAFA